LIEEGNAVFQTCSKLKGLGLAFMLGALSLSAQTPAINVITNMNMGAAVAGATAGTMTLNSPGGTRTSTGGTSVGSSLGVVLTTVTLTGKPGDAWSIAAGAATTTTLTGPGAAMTIGPFDFEPSATNTGTFPASGTTGQFFLGAPINVAANQARGTYTGSFSLRINDTTNGTNSLKSFTITIKIDAPIACAKTADLLFGDVIVGAIAGTVTISPGGVRSATGVTLFGTNPTGAAAFTVSGQANTSYSITLPASVTLNGPAATMTATNFLSSIGTTGLLNAAGTQSFGVGAQLNVAANQTDGDYAGVFSVVVTYN
jgi:Domain of unknown function (DUF4402)